MTLTNLDDDLLEHALIWDRDAHARDLAEQTFGTLLEHVDLHDPVWLDRRILDFGCGTGLLTTKLAPLVREVVAADISAEMLAVLRDKLLENVVLRHTDISTATGLGDFDLVVASCVCGTLADYASTIAHVAAMLRPGGHLVHWDWLVDDDGDDDDDGLTLAAVVAAFERAGLTSVHVDHSFDARNDHDPILIGVARS